MCSVLCAFVVCPSVFSFAVFSSVLFCSVLFCVSLLVGGACFLDAAARAVKSPCRVLVSRIRRFHVEDCRPLDERQPSLCLLFVVASET